jgi:DnaJ like chaperone protein
MLNRIKNILQAELYDYFEKFTGSNDPFADPELEEMIRRLKEEKNADPKTGSQNTYKEQAKATPKKPSKEQEYYEILEVKPGASFEEIKKAYRKMMKIYHPDLFHNDPEKFKMAQEVSSTLNEAYSYFESKNGKK